MNSHIAVDGQSAGEDHTLVGLLRRRAAQAPNRIPYRYGEDGQSWESALDYARLDEAARAIATHLRLLGAGSGDRIGLLYPPGLEFTIGFWGTLYAGMIAVPLAPPQLRHIEPSVKRLRGILLNSDIRLVLTTDSVRRQMLPAMGLLGTACQPSLIASDTIARDNATRWQTPGITAESVAYLQYSSGSTGEPKGVILPHRAVLSNARLMGRAARLTPGESGVCWLPTYHDMGLLASVILPVVHDFTVHHLPPLTFIQRPLTWLRALSVTRGTMGVAPNFAYELCVRRVTPEQAATLDLTHWRLALCGAEPIRASVLHAFAERFAVAGFRRESLFPCYGLAEATLMVAGGPFQGGMRTLGVDADALAQGMVEPSSAPSARELAASGSVHEDLPVAVVDPDSLAPQPDGRIGELLVRGPSLGTGYWNNPDATEATFGVAVPALGEGHLRTGDLGFVRAGQLYVTGRLKDLIIIDGSNHYPQDVEAVATAAHPAVRPSCCAAFQVDAPAQQASVVLVAEIDRAFGPDPEPCATEQPAMCPAEVETAIRGAVHRELNLRLDRVVLVRHGTIPRTTSGKIQRFATAELLRTGGLDPHLIPAPDATTIPAAAPTGGRL